MGVNSNFATQSRTCFRRFLVSRMAPKAPNSPPNCVKLTAPLDAPCFAAKRLAHRGGMR